MCAKFDMLCFTFQKHTYAFIVFLGSQFCKANCEWCIFIDQMLSDRVHCSLFYIDLKMRSEAWHRDSH